MKTMAGLFIFCILYLSNAQAQVSGASEHLKTQAQAMGDAILAADYKKFASYTFPLIVRSMGGTEKMVVALSKGMNDMKAQGTTMTEISFDAPSKMITAGKELQATITQHTTFKLSEGGLINTSTLIAISADNGIHWTFIDTSNKDAAAIKKALPNISAQLVIPPQQQPVRN